MNYDAITLRMSGEMGLGPLEENETTVGAMASFHASVKKMVAMGFLKWECVMQSVLIIEESLRNEGYTALTLCF